MTVFSLPRSAADLAETVGEIDNPASDVEPAPVPLSPVSVVSAVSVLSPLAVVERSEPVPLPLGRFSIGGSIVENIVQIDVPQKGRDAPSLDRLVLDFSKSRILQREGVTIPPNTLMGWIKACTRLQRGRPKADLVLEPLTLAQRTFISGGAWFYFACFSAGTPDKTVYEAWLNELYRLGVMRIAEAGPSS